MSRNQAGPKSARHSISRWSPLEVALRRRYDVTLYRAARRLARYASRKLGFAVRILRRDPSALMTARFEKMLRRERRKIVGTFFSWPSWLFNLEKWLRWECTAGRRRAKEERLRRDIDLYNQGLRVRLGELQDRINQLGVQFDRASEVARSLSAAIKSLNEAIAKSPSKPHILFGLAVSLHFKSRATDNALAGAAVACGAAVVTSAFITWLAHESVLTGFLLALSSALFTLLIRALGDRWRAQNNKGESS